jgi:hypothetical protein
MMSAWWSCEATTNISRVPYLQQISDGSDSPPPVGGGALHAEPGFFVSVPAATAPQSPVTVVRIGSILHGTSILAQGSAEQIRDHHRYIWYIRSTSRRSLLATLTRRAVPQRDNA